MKTDTDLYMMLPRPLNDIPGAATFNAKVKTAHEEQKTLSGIYGEAKKAEREIRVNALVKLCGQLNAERGRLIHEQTIKKASMDIKSLFVQAMGLESIRHNKAVMDFRARLHAALKSPRKAYHVAAGKFVEYSDYFAGCNKPPPYSDATKYAVNLAQEKLSAVEDSFRAEYKKLQATRDQLKNIRKGIRQ